MIRAWILIIAIAAGCKAKDDQAVARLEASTGTVEKAYAPDTPWVDAFVGDKFRLNSAVRTGDASTARLVVGRNGGVLDLEPGSIVRFAANAGAQSTDLRIEAGTAVIESREESLGIGAAKLDKGGRARLSAKDDGLTINVVVGQVVLESGDTVGAGETITVKVGGAIIEEVGKPVPKDAAVEVVDAAVEIDAAPEIVAAAGTKIIVEGKPARVRAKAGGWQPLAVGEHELEDGTKIDAPKGSKVTITRDGAHVRFGGGTEVRLTAPDNPAMVELVRGGVRLEAESGQASAALVGGSIVLESGEVSATMVKDGTELEARRGDATIRSTIAEEKLQEGDTATLDAKGKITFQNRAPTRVVFSVPAGESLTIHDATAPTPVRVRWGGCTGGRLEVAKDARFSRIFARAGGTSGGNALLPVGSYAYRVRCEGGKKLVRGSIKVVRDSGRKPLPKAAPRTLVEPDGREYVISYQNLLPELTFVWRDAPAGRASYTFVIQPASGEAKRIKATSPRVSLKSGELPEGSYKFWVEIPETGGRSAEARIVIDFDNAAATASIEKVVAKDGGKVQVRGTVIEGTTVTAGETKVTLDRHQRFDAELAPREGEQGVAIRIAHRKLGVHYYVLRSSK